MQISRRHYSSRNIFRIDYILSHIYFFTRFENLTFELSNPAEPGPLSRANEPERLISAATAGDDAAIDRAEQIHAEHANNGRHAERDRGRGR